MSELRLRLAVRAIVVDPQDRVLLVRFEFPPDAPGLPRKTVWATPGGGLEEGESDGDGIRRELAEELGYELEGYPGPIVWTRTHVSPEFGGRWDGQTERFYLVRAAAFDPQPRLSRAELAREHVYGMRWWTITEVEASAAMFAPRRFAELLPSLLHEGPPAEPVDVGV